MFISGYSSVFCALFSSKSSVFNPCRFVLKELIQTEKDYVKSLGEVVEVRILLVVCVNAMFVWKRKFQGLLEEKPSGQRENQYQTQPN